MANTTKKLSRFLNSAVRNENSEVSAVFCFAKKKQDDRNKQDSDNKVQCLYSQIGSFLDDQYGKSDCCRNTDHLTGQFKTQVYLCIKLNRNSKASVKAMI